MSRAVLTDGSLQVVEGAVEHAGGVFGDGFGESLEQRVTCEVTERARVEVWCRLDADLVRKLGR